MDSEAKLHEFDEAADLFVDAGYNLHRAIHKRSDPLAWMWANKAARPLAELSRGGDVLHLTPWGSSTLAKLDGQSCSMQQGLELGRKICRELMLSNGQPGSINMLDPEELKAFTNFLRCSVEGGMEVLSGTTGSDAESAA